MKFYKENNINPAASCLPLLAQFPIFIALFYVLRHFAKEADKPGSDLGDLSWLHVVPSVADNVLEPLVGLPAALHLRGEPDLVDVLHVRDDGQDAALDHDGAADRVHPADRELSDRPRPLLDDDEPLDGRAGPGHAPAGAEAGAAAQTDLANAAEAARGRRRRRRRKRAGAAAEADRPAAGRAQEEEAGETVTEDLFVEATGETVGEAKWAALRELERLRPGIDKASVRFEVVTEGERGLLGVGYAPARVVATADRAVERRAGRGAARRERARRRRARARRADRRRARRPRPGRRSRGRPGPARRVHRRATSAS